MFKSKIKSVLLFSGLAVFTLGCNLDYFADAELGDFTWNPNIALPIGEISYKVGDLFKNLTAEGVDIGTNANDVITFTYQEELESQSANDFVGIINQSLLERRPAGISINNPGIASQVSKIDVFPFAWNTGLGEEYDSVAFSSGTIRLELTSELDADVDFTLILRSFENNTTRVPLTVSGTLTPSNPSVSFSDDLVKYIADFSKDVNGNAVNNTFVAELNYLVNISPTTSLQASDGLNVALSIIQPQFDKAYVYVGQRPLDVSFELGNLDFFDTFGEGSISFGAPVFKFNFDNSFGFPLGISFNDMQAITKQGEIINLTGSAVNQVNVIAGPQIANLGSSLETNFELNVNNSNLADLLNSKPSRLVVDVNAFANPDEAPAQYNFILNESELRITGFLEMPFIVNINRLSGNKKLDLNIANALEQANKLILRVITENNIPLGGDVEFAFLDTNDNELYLISERAFFDAAPVGLDGRTSSTVTKIVDIILESNQIRLIEDAVRIEVRTKLSTTNASSGQAVTFFSDYELKIKLAAQADVNVNSNGN
ncbi:MAG: hypothetical protein ACI9Z3_000051 [Roseivirga sp.]|jgi:hypothetical protein